MPTFVYKCSDCNNKYDVFHKTKEEESEVRCPNCSSENSKKVISAANFSGFSTAKACDSSTSGACSTGMCPFN